MLSPISANCAFAILIAVMCLPGRSDTPANVSESASAVSDGCGASIEPGPPDGDDVLLTPSIVEYLTVTRTAARLYSGYVANSLIVRATPLSRRFPGLDSPKIQNTLVPSTSEAESLLRMSPRFVFDWSFRSDYFLKLGLPTLCIQQGARPSVWERNARTIEASAGITGRAEQLSSTYAAGLQRVAASAKQATSIPTVVFVSASFDWRLNTVNSENSDPGAAIAANVKDVTPRGRGAVLDPEQLIAANPDIIVLSQSGVVGDGPDPAVFMADPRWRTLAAVARRRIYAKPKGISIYFSNLLETPLYAQWLAELAHPTLIEPQMRELMRSAYSELGSPVTDEELDAMLRLKQNVGSCGYSRFAEVGPAGNPYPLTCGTPSAALAR